MITLEMVVIRKAALLKDLEQTRNTMNAIMGALQDCEYWLAQLQKLKEQEEGETPPPSRSQL
jgi:hypothetical protein